MGKADKPVAKPADKSADGGLALPSLPGISLPSIPSTFGEAPKAIKTSAEAAPVTPFKKNFINPSDERDLDEIPLTATNIPLLTAFLFGPSFVFLFFWVVGS